MVVLADLPLLVGASDVSVPIPGVGPLVEVFELPSLDPVTVPATATKVSYQRQASGTGTGEVTVQADDPAATLIEPGRHVIAVRRFDGGPTVHTFEVIEADQHTIDDPGSQVVTYRGLGSGVAWDRFRLRPCQGPGSLPKDLDVVHDWRHPAFDVSGWDQATEICTVNAASDLSAGVGVGLWPTQPMAEDFTFGTGAQMLWTTGSDEVSGDLGWVLMVLDIDVETDGRYGIEQLIDNFGSFFVDTVPLLEVNDRDGFQRVSFQAWEMTAGPHRLAWACNNRTGFGDNPGAMAFNLFKVDQQNHPQRDEDDVLLPPVAVSTGDVQIYYAGPTGPWPCWNVGQILGHHLGEAQSRGLATWVAVDFDDTDDSNSVPWPDLETVFVTKVGHTSGLKLLDELTAEGHIGLWTAEPDGVTSRVFGPGHVSDPDVDLVPAPVLDPSTGQVRLLDRRVT